MTKEEIMRINELAKKSKSQEALTQAEKDEQASLRKKYIGEMKASLRGQLDNIHIEQEDGTSKPLSDSKRK